MNLGRSVRMRHIGRAVALALWLSGCSPIATTPPTDQAAARADRPEDGMEGAADRGSPKPGREPEGPPGGEHSADRIPIAVTTGASGIRLAAAGDVYWLVVPADPEAIWPQLEAFWPEHGLPLRSLDRPAGLMETAWTENRVRLPKDQTHFVHRLLSQLSTAERLDRFRVRLARRADGNTHIYLAHRRLVKYPRETGPDRWVDAGHDPALEAAFLSRLAITLGAGSDTRYSAEDLQRAATPRARLVRAENAEGAVDTYIELSDRFPRAWIRVNHLLDVLGLERLAVEHDPGAYDGLVRVAMASESQPLGKAVPPAIIHQAFDADRRFVLRLRGDETGTRLAVVPAPTKAIPVVDPVAQDAARDLLDYLATRLR